MKWFTGKKTYIGAAALAITLIAGFWYGTVDGTTLAAGLSTVMIVIGFGHKYDRYIALGAGLLTEAKTNGSSFAEFITMLKDAAKPKAK